MPCPNHHGISAEGAHGCSAHCHNRPNMQPPRPPPSAAAFAGRHREEDESVESAEPGYQTGMVDPPADGWNINRVCCTCDQVETDKRETSATCCDCGRYCCSLRCARRHREAAPDCVPCPGPPWQEATCVSECCSNVTCHNSCPPVVDDHRTQMVCRAIPCALRPCGRCCHGSGWHGRCKAASWLANS